MLDDLSIGSSEPARWPGEGLPFVTEPRKSAPGLDSLLTWALHAGASRVDFTTSKPVNLRVHGLNRRATTTSLDEAELAQIVNHLYGADGIARLQGGTDIDVSYEIPVSRSQRLRFRLNATPIQTSRRAGVNAVLRPVAHLPPSLEAQRVEPLILKSFRPREGMVIVSGGTGSGKSTLIAGMTVAKLADLHGHYNIVEAASPIEFLLDRYKSASSTIAQTDIPRDLPTFQTFIRGCMRREPTDIIVGECRDSATMGAAVQAAISGHALTTTIHASDVPLTMQRITSLCPADERDNLITCVAQSLRLIINQRLAISTSGGRVALREILVFDRKLRTALLDSDPAQWPAIVRRAVDEQGQSYEVAIKAALSQGLISEETAASEMGTLG